MLPIQIVRRASAIIAMLVLSTVTTAAQVHFYYVAPGPSGSDANDCLSPSKSCATFQRAVDRCPLGGVCNIRAAPGVYSQKTNVFYYKLIAIFPLYQHGNGNCIDRSAIVVDDRIEGVGQAGAIFGVQDHAILTIQCITLAAYANGSVGFTSRQFAIGDVNDVDFRQFRGGLGVKVTETSKVNINSPGIYGDASWFAAASDLSQIIIGGTITVGKGLRFEVAFLAALSNSVVSVNPSNFVGGEAMSGALYQCSDANITTNGTLTGGDVLFAGTGNCIFNATLINPEIKAIHTEIDTNVNPEIKAIHTEIDTNVNPEIKAIRAEIDTKLNPAIKEIYELLRNTIILLRNTIIAALAMLAVVAVVSAFYVWRQRWWRRLPYQSGKLPLTALDQT
jgi:hypothetical protein